MPIEVLPAPTPNDPSTESAQLSPLGENAASDTFASAPSAVRGTAPALGTAMDTDDHGMKRELPSGLVTFVFTDIEASTKLYKLLGDQIAGDVFDLHNVHMRAAWDAFDGHEVHTEGDSFFVVFEDPNQAIAACIDVQQRLARTSWPGHIDVRVRIGIHCGLAAPRNDDYMALAVHQAARVMSAANGCQILVTDAILQRLDPLDGATVARTGRYRLRDFDDAPTLYRIDSTALPRNDHPPRATPASHHNLVPRLTSFVGRDTDVASVAELLEPGTAITVAGLGGMGKTRLATEVGLHVAPAWEAGVWMVELAEVVDPELIAEEVAASIGVEKSGVGSRWDDVTDFIGDHAMLLILDNVEHLIDDAAALVPQLLRACPNSAVLSTSREPLNCQGEVVYRLRPLDVADQHDDPDLIPSVQLFTDRAQAIAADFECGPDEQHQILEICRHLDGLPLAIEIAAAQVGVLQLSEIQSGLSNRFRLLRSRDRALPERQRTMEGLLGWSYQLLSETEQRAFRRLAVFGGNFSIDAAEAALAGNGIRTDDVPELIWTLVDKSLIAPDFSDSATRYRLLESVQQYAMRLLIDHDDPVLAASRLAEWLLAHIGPWHLNDRRWLGDVAIELSNVRSVIELIGAAEPERTQELLCSLGRFHDTRQSFEAGVDELTRGCELFQLETPARVAMLAMLADLHLRMGRHIEANDLLTDAAGVQSRVGPPAWDDSAVQRSVGEIAVRTGKHREAIDLAEAALAANPSDRGAARMWNLLAIAKSATGDLKGALAAGQQELAAHQLLGHASYIGPALGNLAETAWRLGDIHTAARHQQASLGEATTLGQQVLVAYSLIMAARLDARALQWEEAVTLQACAIAALKESGHQLYDEDLTAAHELERDALAALGHDVVHAASQQGAQLPVLEATHRADRAFERAIASTSPTKHPIDT